jgi:hypothetical protein
MLALARDVVAGWKLLDDLNVSGEAGARKNALEEIVTEEGIFGDAAGECYLEGIDVVDAFTCVGALTEEVLVDVRDGRRIGIDTAGAGEDPLIE